MKGLNNPDLPQHRSSNCAALFLSRTSLQVKGPPVNLKLSQVENADCTRTTIHLRIGDYAGSVTVTLTQQSNGSWVL